MKNEKKKKIIIKKKNGKELITSGIYYLINCFTQIRHSNPLHYFREDYR